MATTNGEWPDARFRRGRRIGVGRYKPLQFARRYLVYYCKQYLTLLLLL